MFIAGDSDPLFGPRRDLRASMAAATALPCARSAASMGPAMFIAGDGIEISMNKTTFFASMGPAMFIAGDSGCLQRPAGSPGASMGPAMFIAGDIPASREIRSKACFNGAGDVHRRRYRSRCRFSQGCKCFNGAGDVHRRRSPIPTTTSGIDAQLQWGRRCSSPEICAGRWRVAG